MDVLWANGPVGPHRPQWRGSVKPKEAVNRGRWKGWAEVQGMAEVHRVISRCAKVLGDAVGLWES